MLANLESSQNVTNRTNGRLIIDLSYPADHSVKDGIPKLLCSLLDFIINSTISIILELGHEMLLVKIYIKHVFQLLPVHPTDGHLLVMHKTR